ncbi:hypothetical protein GCM10010295_60820 [Streptomyces intermedius]
MLVVVGVRQLTHAVRHTSDTPEPPDARWGAWYGRGRAGRRNRADHAGGAAATGHAGKGGAVFGHDRVCWIMDRTHGGVSWECGRAAAYEAEA